MDIYPAFPYFKGLKLTFKIPRVSDNINNSFSNHMSDMYKTYMVST